MRASGDLVLLGRSKSTRFETAARAAQSSFYAPAAGAHHRRTPGRSRLASHAGSQQEVDRLWAAAPENGWLRLYAERHPWAGGAKHCVAFLESRERFKVELVASNSPG